MLRRVLWVAVGAAGIALLGAAAGLLLAHRDIRQIEPSLPEPTALQAAVEDVTRSDLPVRLSWIDTATQRMPTGQILALAGGEPDPVFAMSHPVFVLEWSDGRIFLFDLGMDRAGASEFGGPLELAADAEPIEAHGSVAEQLGEAAVARVAGVAFSHLHVDHVGGVDALCAAHPGRIRWIRTGGQAERGNFTTRPGEEQLKAAACLDGETLARQPVAVVPGFPGLALVEAAGHTPGGQIGIAHVRSERASERWIFTGDVVNHVRGILEDRDKPLLYRLFVVPESSEQLGRARRWLRALHEDQTARLLVSHDRAQLVASGLPRWKVPDA